MSKIKKQNILPIPPQFDRAKLQAAGTLPNIESVNQSVANLTGKPLQADEPTQDSPNKPVGRPKKMPSVGRIAYNTMIQEDLIIQLKIMAAHNRLSTADLIEEALLDFFEKKKNSILPNK
jgi:hypothetical protein